MGADSFPCDSMRWGLSLRSRVPDSCPTCKHSSASTTKLGPEKMEFGHRYVWPTGLKIL